MTISLVQTQPRFYTPEEYLDLEEVAEAKNEYRNGEIVPMTGGSTDHNDIAGNLGQFKLEVHHLEGCLRGTHRDSLIFTTIKRHPYELHPA